MKQGYTFEKVFPKSIQKKLFLLFISTTFYTLNAFPSVKIRDYEGHYTNDVMNSCDVKVETVSDNIIVITDLITHRKLLPRHKPGDACDFFNLCNGQSYVYYCNKKGECNLEGTTSGESYYELFLMNDGAITSFSNRGNFHKFYKNESIDYFTISSWCR